MAQAVTKGYYSGDLGGSRPLLVGQLSRWWPNIILLPFGILALIWRARWAEGRIPFRSVVKLTGAVTGWIDRRRDAAAAAGTRSAPASGQLPASARARRRSGVGLPLPRVALRAPHTPDHV